MKITSIEAGTNKHVRLSVYVDEKYCFSVSKRDYNDLGLYVDKEIDQEQISFIKKILNVDSAKFCAINFLSYKIRSEKEVSDKLVSQGFDADEISSAISGLQSIGYIDDRIYAQKYIRDRIKLKPLSRTMLKFNLKTKGVSQVIIEKALEESGVDDLATAMSLINKKFGKFDLNNEKVYARAYTFMVRRGFNHEVISRTIRKVSEENDLT